ncbi:MFS transporter [Hoeflea sp. YIM 152468]|uniref:MFS transporter n=1 Tax=Hoeflea sp. YIM 152468 TaxID=3031759 RepID=UPI0023DB30F0|nr:MFS transporter [Hoeflea sp. YIM 152468]MDF1608516.1 MFS transporter [Hoeflea sp. YIM 152468]
MAKPEFAATRYYALAFLAPAVTITYLPIWLNERGISDAGIGMINTLPMAGMLLFSVFAGRLADRASDWKQAIMLGTGLCALFSLLLGFAEGFWMILLVWTMAILPAGLVSPVADAATLRLSMRLGFSFGTTRAWGTIGFLLTCFATGYLILWLGASSFVWLFAVACGLRFWAATGLPKLRDADRPRTNPEGRLLSREVMAAFQPWVLLPVIAGAILFANHMVMNAFSSLVWKQQGLSEPVIGVLIALGAAAEAATMFAWKRINTRFPARVLILIAGVVAIARWIGMTQSPPLAIIVMMQLGQAVTFTFAYLGCLYFINKRTSEDISAEAQSLFGVMMQGYSILVVAGFGVAFGMIGVNAFWICVALSVLAIGMVQQSLRMRGPDPSD